MLQTHHMVEAMKSIQPFQYVGRVESIRGQLVECTGPEEVLSVGTRCHIHVTETRHVSCEIVGFHDRRALLMGFHPLDGVGYGNKVTFHPAEDSAHPDASWLGRVINGMGEPIDDKGPLIRGLAPYAFKASPPPPQHRQTVEGKLDMGVRAINVMTTCCRGQRMGIFAGSGVGKSVLLAMLTRYAAADVKVIGLIGERGREAQEFIHHHLGSAGLENAVVVVSTGNETALMRRQASYLTMAIAEYFRDQGKDVLCLMDSITRFAMAQREIGLSIGEPPTSKGYTPSVFSEMARLLERAGQGIDKGGITGLFSVLVEGDDRNEPIADTVRGIVDGHIWLDRKIAERGRYPAIDVLASVSRMMPHCNTPWENGIVRRMKELLSTYEDMADMIRLGAYHVGSDPKVDEAIHYYPEIEAFLSQQLDETTPIEDCYVMLAKALDLEVAQEKKEEEG